ncbi:MAG: TonB-dependent receptor plug domain-containing protein, partial [Gammaproteobacteria bacterium]
MDVSNLSPDHAVSIDPLQASQIEILKGPATLLYGSGAVGGIVNIVTDRIPTRVPDAPGVDGYFRFDSATNERTGGGKVEAGLGNLAFHLDGLKRRTSDYEIPGFGSIEPAPGEQAGELFSSDVDTENVAGGTSYVGDRGYLGFSVAHFASNYGIPGVGDEAGVRIDLDQLRYDIAGELKNPGAPRLKLRLGHNDYEHLEIEP